MYIDKSDIAKIKELPIESVAERLGLRVERHRNLCPFHDDSHPSMTYNVRSNRFKCFVCDAHGGVIDLVEKKLGIGFKDACRWLADSSNVILEETKTKTEAKPFDASRYVRFFERPFINQAAGEFLFEKRHIDPRVVRWCRLTSWKNWLQIPFFDIDGNLTGVQWRNLNSQPSAVSSQPRFRFPYGSQCHIYNLPVLKLLHPGEELWIAEGCSDCWSLLSSGYKAIAIPSATLLKPKDLEILLSLSSSLSLSIHMFPDNDLPGERLFLKLKELLPNIIRHQLPQGCKDYSDYYLSQVLTVNR